MIINVIGMGYIGLPTALMLAANGMEVVGTDYNSAVIDKLNHGEVTFKEEGLEDLFFSAKRMGMQFSDRYQETTFYVVSVPTPYDAVSKKVDATYVQNAVGEILKHCLSGSIIVIESTISPGTIDKYVRPEIEKSGLIIGKDVFLAHAPERIIPGNMIYELEHNNRTIGADDENIANKVKQVYSSFCKGEIVITDIRTAEMTKVVENTFRDINIAYANELAKICRSDNMDVYEIIKIANMHPRVNILSPGPGVGGHCISVDPWFLVGDYPGLANIILAARKINDSMPEFVLERIYDIMRENKISDLSRVGLYGLTYKENVDDVRESPTLQLLESQRKHLAYELKVYDPYVKEDVVANQYHDFDLFLEEIDLVVIMVGHNEIKNATELLKGKLVFDTRSLEEYPNAYHL